MWICAYIVMGQEIAMQELIKATKALSDETRLRMLNLLLERECCVCEVMQALDISQSRASRNLGILQEAGFLTAKRDGLWIVYSIDWQTANSHAASLARLLKDSPIADELTARDRARLKQAVRK
jgi:ArsR family transcriptional regulator